LQQRVLPAYRAPFFDHLAAVFSGGLSVFAGQPRPEEATLPAQGLEVARYFPARNLNFGSTRSPLYLCWQAGLLRWLQDWQPDVLVAEANSRNISTWQALGWMHSRKRPVIGWGLGAPQGSGELQAVRLPGRLRFLRSFDAMIAYSRQGAEEYCRLGYPPELVFVAPNAATPPPAHPPPTRPPALDGRPSVLFVGRLQARKRVDLLLKACADLPPALQPRLTVVGEGPARAELERLAGEIYPGTEFPGDRRGEALRPFFTQADLFVLPGTGGLAVHEAMAHGLPVIVAEGDGTQEDLVRPGNGWQVQPGSLETLTAALAQAFSDPGRLRQMGAESYRIVLEEVNFEVMAGVFLQAVERVTDRIRRSG
jgi:glycosyltransferase involved in cell wall biosynthesis